MVYESLCNQCIHGKDCDLKPKGGAHLISACISFCATEDIRNEEIIEKIDFIRMKKIPPERI